MLKTYEFSSGIPVGMKSTTVNGTIPFSLTFNDTDNSIHMREETPSSTIYCMLGIPEPELIQGLPEYSVEWDLEILTTISQPHFGLAGLYSDDRPAVILWHNDPSDMSSWFRTTPIESTQNFWSENINRTKYLATPTFGRTVGEKGVLKGVYKKDFLYLYLNNILLYSAPIPEYGTPVLMTNNIGLKIHSVTVSYVELQLSDIHSVSVNNKTWANKETKAQANPQPVQMQFLKQEINPTLIGKTGNYNSLIDQNGKLRSQGFLAGTTKINKTTIAPNRRVLCYSQFGQLVDETRSDKDGNYRFDHLMLNEKYMLIAQDAPFNGTHDYQPAATDYQTPEAYS